MSRYFFLPKRLSVVNLRNNSSRSTYYTGFIFCLWSRCGVFLWLFCERRDSLIPYVCIENLQSNIVVRAFYWDFVQCSGGGYISCVSIFQVNNDHFNIWVLVKLVIDCVQQTLKNWLKLDFLILSVHLTNGKGNSVFKGHRYSLIVFDHFNTGCVLLENKHANVKSDSGNDSDSEVWKRSNTVFDQLHVHGGAREQFSSPNYCCLTAETIKLSYWFD